MSKDVRGKNHQLMTWVGTIEELWSFLGRSKRLDVRTINVYKTKTPNFFVWSTKQLGTQVLNTFGLRLEESRTVGPKGKPVLQVIKG